MKILKIEKENDKIIVYYKKKLFEKFEIDFHQFVIGDGGKYVARRHSFPKKNIMCVVFEMEE